MQFPVLIHRLKHLPSGISYHCESSDFGTILTAWVQNDEQLMLCGLLLIDEPKQALSTLKERWPESHFKLLSSTPSPLPAQSFADGTTVIMNAFPVAVCGTDFQIAVWEALLTIPFATNCTYQDIAKQINNPKAVQAVGSAIGANPIANLIPCHRVIRQDKKLGGYRWGLARKQQLLDWENSYL